MMIKDEDGNEHELKVGQLVQAERWDGPRLFRVERIRATNVYCVDRVADLDIARGAEYFTWISDEPIDEEKEPTLSQRRQRLLMNLDRAYRQSSYDDRATLHQLIDALYREAGENAWFWHSVAESLDDPRQVSYAPTKDAYDINAKRRRCRVSKFLKTVAKRFGLDVTNEQADRIGELVGAHFPSSYDYTFEVVRGDGAVYDGYADRANESWSSCMHIGNGRAKSFVRWYDENPDKVGLVKIMQGSQYVGRALIWTADDGAIIVDRVYPSDNGPHTAALHAWCEENGYDYKTRQACYDGYLKSGRDDYCVTVKPSSSGDYPYCDTFKYTDDDPESDATLRLSTSDGEYTFNATDGTYEGGRSRYTCTDCGERLDEDDYHSGDDGYIYCESCYDGRFTYLSYQRPNGHWVERTVANDDAACCEHCDQYRLRNHLVEVRVGRYHEDWCEQCREDDACLCAHCEEYHEDGLSTEVGGDLYCSDCASEVAEQCSECGDYFLKEDMLVSNDAILCSGCCEDEDAKPLVEPKPKPAPPVVQPAVAAAPAEVDSYPTFGPICHPREGCCEYCVAIRRRRYQEATRLYGHRCNCPNIACTNDRERFDAYVNAPYPNEQEAEVLRQREAARNAAISQAYTASTNANSRGLSIQQALDAHSRVEFERVFERAQEDYVAALAAI